MLPTAEADPVSLRCLNGPCVDAMVDTPPETVPGTATAIAWHTTKGEPRYAVYIVVESRGMHGLMYLKSYQKPYQAQQRVQQVTAVCSMGVVS